LLSGALRRAVGSRVVSTLARTEISVRMWRSSASSSGINPSEVVGLAHLLVLRPGFDDDLELPESLAQRFLHDFG